MYTDAMRRAFHSIHPPKNFGVTLMDNDNFITIKLNEHDFTKMAHDDKIEAVKYVAMVKNALEMEGAIVLVTREAIK